jgi:hypothetical protein
MHLFGFGEQAAGFVLYDRVVFPRVPMPEHNFHELVGAVVARIMADDFLAAHVLRLAVVERGNDVPGGAAAGHQVKRAKDAGDVKRLVVACGISGAEAEALGRHTHHGQHSEGIELHAANAVLDGMGVIAPIHVRHRKPIVEKAEMELAGFQHAANMAVEIRRPAIGARLRVTPGAREVGAILRLQKANHDHLAHVTSPLQEK